MKRWMLISYDVRNPARLRKVAKILEGYGERIQFSVFRARLPDREAERLRWELAKVMSPEDELLLVGLCTACAGKISSRQAKEAWLSEPPGHLVL